MYVGRFCIRLPSSLKPNPRTSIGFSIKISRILAGPYKFEIEKKIFKNFFLLTLIRGGEGLFDLIVGGSTGGSGGGDNARTGLATGCSLIVFFFSSNLNINNNSYKTRKNIQINLLCNRFCLQRSYELIFISLICGINIF